jgi:iron(III) transport system substrate-binding protein
MINSTPKKLALFTGVTLAAISAASAGSITVYTALEEAEIKSYLEQAKEDLPDIEINVLRLSTGDLGPKILAESKNPQNDVVWGWAVTSMINPKISTLLEPYKAQGVDNLPEQFKSPDEKWFAATGYMAAFCINTKTLEQLDIPAPTSWADLTKPIYKGEVVMPNPVSSGTGYLQISALLQSKGDDAGWEYLQSLDNNIAQYTKSGSRPCKAARMGEYAIGASLAFSALQSIDEGYPITMVVPEDAAGFELEASGLMASSKNKADAKRFLDWTLSKQATELYTEYKSIVTIPGAPTSSVAESAGLPADISTILFPVDFAKSAADRDAILSKWQKTIAR